jgi:hypothetical protein
MHITLNSTVLIEGGDFGSWGSGTGDEISEGDRGEPLETFRLL